MKEVNLEKNIDLMLPYFSENKQLIGLINGFNKLYQKEFIDFLELFENSLSLDGANNWLLDRLGNNVGFKRPYISNNKYKYFGFDDNGVNFDIAPFFQGSKNELVPMGDTIYRKLLKVWIGYLLFDGSIYMLKKVISETFKEITIVENDNFSIDIILYDLDEFTSTSIINNNVIPKVAGIKYNYIRHKDE